MDTVKVAIIGAGPMVNNAHAPSLAALEDVQLVGICDLNEKLAENTAATRTPCPWTSRSSSPLGALAERYLASSLRCARSPRRPRTA
jgi:predicted dehydrogenase